MRKLQIRQIARVAVERLILDLVSRSGMQEEWERIPETERMQIRDEWVSRVAETLEPILTDMMHYSQVGKENG